MDGLKPDMTAEVTIHVDAAKSRCWPSRSRRSSAGPRWGRRGRCSSRTAAGYEEREVTLGLSNEKMVEVRDGLAEGDEVVLNPKVLLGDKAKTREDGDAEPAAPARAAAARAARRRKGGGKAAARAASRPKGGRRRAAAAGGRRAGVRRRAGHRPADVALPVRRSVSSSADHANRLTRLIAPHARHRPHRRPGQELLHGDGDGPRPQGA